MNLKQLGICLAMYAAHDDGDPYEYLPPLSPRPGCLIMEPNGVLFEHIVDPQGLFSFVDPLRYGPRAQAGDPAFCCENSSYIYLGYFVWDDLTIEAFADAYKENVRVGDSFADDLVVGAPVTVLKRLDLGVYRQMIPDTDSDKPGWAHLKHPHSEIPLLIERPREYPGPYGLAYPVPIPLSSPTTGGCVLYLDGHVEFIAFPGKWPMTERTIKALLDVSALRDHSSI